MNEAAPRDASEWLRNIEEIEPRAKADNMFVGFDAFNNPGHSSWSANNWGRQVANAGKKTNFPAAIEAGKGCAAPVKFYYRAGTRVWFEFPLFRLAETYLNLAEAYNEKGVPAKASKI